MKGKQMIVGVALGVVLTIGVQAAADFFCWVPKTRYHLIRIGPTEKDIAKGEDPAYISLKNGDQVTWQSTDKEPLIIEFEKAKFPNNKPPFLGMIDSPTDKNFLRVDCPGGDECRSGPINTDLRGDLGLFTCLEYKYDQQKGTKRADGWIIIRP